MASFAGSILDNGTKATPGVPYYSGGGGGSTFASASISSLTVSSINGAAPGGASGPAVTTSSLTVSSISGLAGGQIEMNTLVQISSIGGALGPGGQTAVQNGLQFLTGSAATFNADGEIIFSDSLGVMTGVSSINGSAYPPAGALTVQTAPLANGGAIVLPENSVGGPIAITGLFATTAGKLYQASVKVTDENLNPAGPPPTAGDHYAFIDPTAGVAATRTYAELSSIRGAGQPRGETVYFNFVAGGATAQLSAYNNLGTTQSTLLTLDNTYQCRVVQLN